MKYAGVNVPLDVQMKGNLNKSAFWNKSDADVRMLSKAITLVKFAPDVKRLKKSLSVVKALLGRIGNENLTASVADFIKGLDIQFMNSNNSKNKDNAANPNPQDEEELDEKKKDQTSDIIVQDIAGKNDMAIVEPAEEYEDMSGTVALDEPVNGAEAENTTGRYVGGKKEGQGAVGQTRSVPDKTDTGKNSQHVAGKPASNSNSSKGMKAPEKTNAGKKGNADVARAGKAKAKAGMSAPDKTNTGGKGRIVRGKKGK